MKVYLGLIMLAACTVLSPGFLASYWSTGFGTGIGPCFPSKQNMEKKITHVSQVFSTPVTNLYFRIYSRIFEKLEMAPTGYPGP